MINLRSALLLLPLVLVSCSRLKYVANPVLEPGISRQLATYRKSVLSAVNYKLELDIPREMTTGINASEELTFLLSANLYPLQIDFKADKGKLKSLRVNGSDTEINYNTEHLTIAKEALKKGQNKIEFLFEAGEGALNRNADYLYSLFVPDRARTVFPCFDQPDLKGTYTLTLKVPADWKAMTNGILVDSMVSNDRKTYHFNTSDTLSTYLFAFAAGRFDLVDGKVASLNTEFLYRETDTAKIKQSLNEIFHIHTASLKYYEEWTKIRYPFQKFGFVAIPDFQFGGMEHAGAIQYKASALFLDAGATKDQLNARGNLIAHETAHMWFGDLVTMNWFNDVWMKEVFANFMADKSTADSTDKDVFDLKFLVDHFPLAYGVDRTTGANAIRQNLDNLKDAGTMYGNIIYHKAPVMMRQLERLMGKEKFQQGVREYLKKFANRNASWPDLISILDKYADADLQQWNQVWVNETGRPVINYQIEKDQNMIRKFVISQKREYGANRIWPQLFEIKFYYADHHKEFSVNLDKAQVELKEAAGMDVPLFVLFNSSGQGYGLWPLDTLIFDKVYEIKKPLERASAFISLYENMLVGRAIQPKLLLDLFTAGLTMEHEELNIKLMTNYLGTIYWEFLTEDVRKQVSISLEKKVWEAMEQQKEANVKKILFKTYQDICLSEYGRNRLYAIWDHQKTLDGIKFTEDDYTTLAFALALRDDKDPDLLKKQLTRITNNDRRTRFEFIMPAVSSKKEVRDAFFNSLALKSNRGKEANVVAALSYLHHPLRQKTSINYLAKSLEMLSEIQTTGDIFFPQSWLQSTFGYYQSPAASRIVKDFLQRNPDYNPKLKAKILQTADNLFKAEVLLK